MIILGIMSQSIKITGPLNPWFGTSLPKKTLELAAIARTRECILTMEEFIQRAKEKYGEKYDYSDVKYTHSKIKVYIKCIKHDHIFFQKPNDHLSGYDGCIKCAPHGFSKEEKEVADFVKSFYVGEVIENSRNIISPKELDIYIPAKKFAIEYNGLFWHSTENIDKKKHYSKTKACLEKDITLFHIFSDEWIHKQEIVKSMIKYRLGMVDRKVAARKCEMRIIDKTEGKQFFIDSHISGDNRAGKYFGLLYEGKLVCCLSVKKPIQKKHGNVLEIARFANAINTTVQGGFQKLQKEMEKYAKENGFSGILTYADLRFGEGKTYLNSGFTLLKKSPIDYWYTNGQIREFRFKYHADKINKLTEKQVADKARSFSYLWLWFKYLS